MELVNNCPNCSAITKKLYLASESSDLIICAAECQGYKVLQKIKRVPRKMSYAEKIKRHSKICSKLTFLVSSKIGLKDHEIADLLEIDISLVHQWINRGRMLIGLDKKIKEIK